MPDREATLQERAGLAEAHRFAAATAASASVDVRLLVELPDLRAVVALFDDIWSTRGSAPIGLEHLRALAFAGSFVAGAYAGPQLVGACVAFLSEPVGRGLHSDVTGVARDARSRGIGLALKMSQRAWALERGLNRIFWTFDPLVARNAHFNLNRLGASVDAYLVDFYGDMSDGINAGQGSDRLHACWVLDEEQVSDDPGLPDGEPLLTTDPSGAPAVTETAPGADRCWVAVPAEVEQLRRQDPQLARRWRESVRATLGAELAAGGRIVAFDRDRGYLVKRRGAQ